MGEFDEEDKEDDPCWTLHSALTVHRFCREHQPQ